MFGRRDFIPRPGRACVTGTTLRRWVGMVRRPSLCPVPPQARLGRSGHGSAPPGPEWARPAQRWGRFRPSPPPAPASAAAAGSGDRGAAARTSRRNTPAPRQPPRRRPCAGHCWRLRSGRTPRAPRPGFGRADVRRQGQACGADGRRSRVLRRERPDRDRSRRPRCRWSRRC